MRCRRCGDVAVIDVRRHNAAFCTGCFQHHCQEQVRRAIDDHDMLERGDRVLVAVSGGKDSLACWHLLRRLGYDADGLYVGLGIGEYSEESRRCTVEFAAAHGWPLRIVDLPSEHGFGIPDGAAAARRVPCSACGLSKRHLFNQSALVGGYDAVATGHNLDDEAAVLLGNVLRWDEQYLARQFPVLAAAPGFVRKVKPLVRLGEREMAAYCVLVGIDYIVEECPMAVGNRHLRYKEMLNAFEDQSPGTKASFVLTYFDRVHERFADEVREEREALVACTRCGAPTPAEVCAFCRLQEKAAAHPQRRISVTAMDADA